jgi:hypothetical protein
MNIQLHVNPQTPPMSFGEFCLSHPAYSISLDGYVAGIPAFDRFGPWANFNHHEDVDRLATRCTCAQVLMAIRSGLFSVFKNGKGSLSINVYVNDCDEDCCLSWFLLSNPSLSQNVVNPLLNRLVSLEDALDSTAGAFPFPDTLTVLGELGWVFEPYRRFRLSGELDKRDPDSFRSIITDVCSRITQHVIGKGSSVELDFRYKVLEKFSKWSMVEEIGSHARAGLYSDGIKAFLSVREQGNGKWSYIIGRQSQFIPFEIPSIIARLNAAEAQDSMDKWGGSPLIAGSPRIGGSKLSPPEVAKIIEQSA